MNVSMIVQGLPHSNNPSRGVFNLRTAQGLRKHCNLTVIWLRYWRFGRSLAEWTVIEGIPVLIVSLPCHVKSPYYWTLFASRLVHRYLRPVLENVDVIHSVSFDFAAIVASHWVKRFQRPHVAQIISQRSLETKRAWRFLKRLFPRIHAVVCNSKAVQALAQKKFSIECPVTTIYRGVDLSQFNPDGAQYPLSTHRTATRFLYMGGFPDTFHGGVKGGDVLLKAWKFIESRLNRSGASLLIGGPSTERPEVRSWRQSLQYPDRVQILGQINPSEMPSLYRAVDCVIIPSLSEGLPNVSMEAAACGKAVIGTMAGGIPEVIVDQQTGWLVPTNDDQALANAILSAVSDPHRLRVFGTHARQRMETSFDAARYPQALLEFYGKARDYFTQVQSAQR